MISTAYSRPEIHSATARVLSVLLAGLPSTVRQPEIQAGPERLPEVRASIAEQAGVRASAAGLETAGLADAGQACLHPVVEPA